MLLSSSGTVLYIILYVIPKVRSYYHSILGGGQTIIRIFALNYLYLASKLAHG